MKPVFEKLIVLELQTMNKMVLAGVGCDRSVA